MTAGAARPQWDARRAGEHNSFHCPGRRPGQHPPPRASVVIRPSLGWDARHRKRVLTKWGVLAVETAQRVFHALTALGVLVAVLTGSAILLVAAVFVALALRPVRVSPAAAWNGSG